MKFTKISSDKAYKLYKNNNCENLYFKSFADPFDYMRIESVIRYDDRITREFFRGRTTYIGEELPKVTVRQEIECHCVDKWNNTNEKVIKMITLAKTGKDFNGYLMSQELADTVFAARSITKKYILFDVDSNGEKSNFRFE